MSLVETYRAWSQARKRAATVLGDADRPAEFYRLRAETSRRRARAFMLVIAGLWGPLMIYVDPMCFGSFRGGLWARLPTMGGLFVMGFYLRRPRSRGQIEGAVVAAFGFLFVVWARVVVVCAPPSVLPAMVSIVATGMAVSTALLLTWQSTAILCLIANVAMLVGGLLREPRPDATYFNLITTAFILYPMLVFSAGSRDKWQRSELEAREKLWETNEQLHREQEARSRLFVNLSHDFRTPLAVVRSAVELLRRPGRTADLGITLDRIDANAASIVELIDQLLELARLDAAKTPLLQKPCDVGAIVREVTGQLASSPAEVRITVPATDRPVIAKVDPSHLKRILQNLIANALRQLVHSGGNIRVETRRDDAGRATVDVIDDGPGVAPQLRGKIFERFASFRPEGGTVSGIGLALARELAELNGATLELLDAAETTFRLTLTLADEPAVAPEAAPQTPAARTPVAVERLVPAPAPSPGLDDLPHLLVVEDNDDLRLSLEGLLAPRFRVEAVASVGAARASLCRSMPAAILTDIMLPDGQGYDLLAAVRLGRRMERIPVVVLTALGEPADRVRGLTAGADDYLAKPFSGDELCARIEAAIRKARERTAAIEQQREDLLMDLHDGVCGSLARSILALDTACLPHAGDAALASAVTSVRHGLGEARGLLDGLGTGAEPWEGLVARLRWESTLACDQAGLGFELGASQDDGAPILVSAAATHAARRIAAEAITNAVKHARATRVRMQVDSHGGELRLRIEDDGSGGAQPDGRGHGLASISRRAARLGGGATFANGSSGGFIVEAWLQRG